MSSPLIGIWIRPRETIRRIIAEEDTKRYVAALACIYGVGRALERFSLRNAGDKMRFEYILILAVVIGPLSGLLAIWIYSHLIRLSGRWLRGHAPFEYIRAALGWASVPAVAAVALWIPYLILLGPETFQSQTPRLESSILLLAAIGGLELSQWALGVWSLVLACKTIAEVQGYPSAWRGLGNIILAACVIIVPLLAVIGIIFALTR